MGLTLLEASKRETDPARLAVISELAEGELMGMIPFQDIVGSGVFYNRETELPSVGFRGINETLDDSYGIINPQSEALKIFGGDVDVDRALVDFYGGETRANQIEMKVRAMRMSFESAFINGSEAENPRSFDGLKRRINTGSSQFIANGNSALSLAKLDELVDVVDALGGERVLVMDKAVRRSLIAASRATGVSGFITHDRDEMGRRITRYADTPIVVVDRDSQNARILDFTEASSTTSVYCVAMGDTLSTAFQGSIDGSFGISVRDLGEVQDAPVYRTRIEWYCGVAIYNGRSAGRLAGITAGAVVA